MKRLSCHIRDSLCSLPRTIEIGKVQPHGSLSFTAPVLSACPLDLLAPTKSATTYFKSLPLRLRQCGRHGRELHLNMVAERAFAVNDANQWVITLARVARSNIRRNSAWRIPPDAAAPKLAPLKILYLAPPDAKRCVAAFGGTRKSSSTLYCLDAPSGRRPRSALAARDLRFRTCAVPPPRRYGCFTAVTVTWTR